MAKKKGKFYLYSKKLISRFVGKNEITRQQRNYINYRLIEMAKENDEDYKIIEDEESNFTSELFKADLSLKFKINHSNDSDIDVAVSGEKASLPDGSTLKKSYSKKLVATIKISHIDIPQTNKSVALDEEENISTDRVYEIHVIQNKFSVRNLATYDVIDAQNSYHKDQTSSIEHCPLITHNTPSATATLVTNRAEVPKIIPKKNSSTVTNSEFNIEILGPKGFGEVPQEMTRWKSVPNIPSGGNREFSVPAVRVETRESFVQTENRPRKKRKSRFRRALEEMLFCCAGTCM